MGGSIIISSGSGTATSSGSLSILTNNAGASGMSGALLVSTGTANAGNSGSVEIASGSSSSGSGVGRGCCAGQG